MFIASFSIIHTLLSAFQTFNKEVLKIKGERMILKGQTRDKKWQG